MARMLSKRIREARFWARKGLSVALRFFPALVVLLLWAVEWSCPIRTSAAKIVPINVVYQGLVVLLGIGAQVLKDRKVRDPLALVFEPSLLEAIQRVKKALPTDHQAEIRSNIMVVCRRWHVQMFLQIFCHDGQYKWAECDLHWELGHGNCGVAWRKNESRYAELEKIVTSKEYEDISDDKGNPDYNLSHEQWSLTKNIPCILSIPLDRVDNGNCWGVWNIEFSQPLPQNIVNKAQIMEGPLSVVLDNWKSVFEVNYK